MRIVRLAALAALLVQSSVAIAQTVIQVPYGAASFYWDAPLNPVSGVGVTQWYVLNCGGADIRVDVPAVSLPVQKAVAGPGTYTCTLKAANTFGTSAPASFPVFEAGYQPAPAKNLRLVVK